MLWTKDRKIGTILRIRGDDIYAKKL